jgi:ribokinase
MDVVVVGSCNVDLNCSVAEFPHPGQTIKSTSPHMQCCGGKGANQAVQAARLGAKVAMVAMVGNDAFGREYVSTLSAEGIDTSSIGTSSRPTGLAFIYVDQHGQNMIVISEGANADLSTKHVESCLDVMSHARVLVFQMETPVESSVHAIRAVRQRCASEGRVSPLVVFNPAPAPSDGCASLPKDFFSLIDVFCPNETEAALLTGMSVNALDNDAGIEQAVQKLLAFGSRFAVITLGQRGVVHSSTEGGCRRVPAVKVERVVDSTGAGDSFVGAFASFVAETFAKNKVQTEEDKIRVLNSHLSDAIAFANKVAGFSVQHKGTQPSYPRANQLS